MIDNFMPRYDIKPSDSNDNIVYHKNNHLGTTIAQHRIDDRNAISFERSADKVGYKFDNNMYLKMGDTGTAEAAWYYLPNNTYEVTGQLADTLDYNDGYYHMFSDISLSGFVLNSANPFENIGAIYHDNITPTLDLSNAILGQNCTEINFENYHGIIRGLGSLNYANITDIDISDASIASIDFSDANLSNLENFDCTSLTTSFLDLSNTDLSNVQDIDCYNLDADEVNLSGVTGDINTILGAFLEGDVTTIDVSNWDLTNVTVLDDILEDKDFRNVTGFNTWDVSNVTSFNNIFNGTFEGGYPSDFTLDLSGWNLSNASTICGTFGRTCNLDLSNWILPSDLGTGYYGGLICGYYPSSINVSNWDLTNTTNLDYVFMVDNDCTGAEDIIGLDTWNVSGITHMMDLFINNKIPISDLANWDVSNVTSFVGMFYNTQDSDTNERNFGGIDSWRNILPNNANYSNMLGDIDEHVTCPQWNGWFDEYGTFMPYTGNEVAGGLYFKGLILNQSSREWSPSDMPANPSTGDAYRIYTDNYGAYYTGYYAYDGTQWLDLNSNKEYLEFGYYQQSCDDYWNVIDLHSSSEIPIRDGCGYFELGDQHIFQYEAYLDTNHYLGVYEWDGTGWYKVNDKLYIRHGDDPSEWWELPADQSQVPTDYTNYLYTARIDDSLYQYGYYDWTWDGIQWIYNEPNNN